LVEPSAPARAAAPPILDLGIRPEIFKGLTFNTTPAPAFDRFRQAQAITPATWVGFQGVAIFGLSLTRGRDSPRSQHQSASSRN